MCHIGQCISACNPPCPSGLQCTQQLTCEPPPDIHKEQTIADYEATKRRATVQRHDGFYLRVGITMGYGVDRANLGDQEVVSTGLGGFLDYAIGGTLTDGLVLAFGHHTLANFSPQVEFNGRSADAEGSAVYQVIGALLDFYPDPTDGWHIAWTIGFGSARSSYGSSSDSSLGLGLALGGGYDVWFADQWSFGIAARLMYIHDASDALGDHNALVPMLNFSVLFH